MRTRSGRPNQQREPGLSINVLHVTLYIYSMIDQRLFYYLTPC